MKLYEQYLQELGLGKKIALGAAATLGGTIAYGIHKGNKRFKALEVSGGKEWGRHLIGIANNKVFAGDDGKIAELQEKKCGHLEFESSALHNCWKKVFELSARPLYISELKSMIPKCKDPICV